MQHAFKIGDAEHNVALSRRPGGYRLHLGDTSTDIALREAPDGRVWLTLGERHVEVVVATRGDDIYIHLDGEAHQLRYRHPLDRLAAQLAGSADDRITAPMPGSIVSAPVKAGDAVTRGQTVLVMESMKMETTLVAPRDGQIEAVHFEVGQTFDRDAVLLTLAAMETES
jgi:acetyl/propionyl-CoA carboxylase alpha subunit